MQSIYIITGPTASGKTSVLHHIPRDSPIEIISADSRQIYKHIPITSCMPEKELQEKFPHHMIDFLEPHECFSAYNFLQKSQNIIQQIHNKNKIPVIIGGTFFYLKSLLDGLGSAQKNISKLTKKSLQNYSIEELQQYLAKIDKKSYQTIHPNDRYRIQKAITQYLQSGIPYSQITKKGGIYKKYRCYIYCIEIERKKLYEQINTRTKYILQNGVIKEFMHLVEMKNKFDYPIFNTIGLKQLKEITNSYFQNNEEYSSKELIEKIYPLLDKKKVIEELFTKISQKTRNFAKNQLTWIKSEKRIIKIDYENLISIMVDNLNRF